MIYHIIHKLFRKQWYFIDGFEGVGGVGCTEGDAKLIGFNELISEVMSFD
jgi:hypothetical protein